MCDCLINSVYLDCDCDFNLFSAFSMVVSSPSPSTTSISSMLPATDGQVDRKNVNKDRLIMKLPPPLPMGNNLSMLPSVRTALSALPRTTSTVISMPTFGTPEPPRSAASHMSLGQSSKTPGVFSWGAPATTESAENQPSRKRPREPADATKLPKRIRLDFSSNATVQINVSEAGQEPVSFHVPRKLLVTNSTHFASACGASSFDNTFALAASSAAFSIWLQALYQQEVIIEDGDSSPPVSGAEEWKLLAEVYVLALRLGDFASANLVMSAILQRIQSPLAHQQQDVVSAIEIAFTSSGETDVADMMAPAPATPTKLRQLLIDYGVHRLSSDTLSKISGWKGASEYLFGITKAFIEARERGTGFGGFSMVPHFEKSGSKMYDVEQQLDGGRPFRGPKAFEGLIESTPVKQEQLE